MKIKIEDILHIFNLSMCCQEKYIYVGHCIKLGGKLYFMAIKVLQAEKLRKVMKLYQPW